MTLKAYIPENTYSDTVSRKFPCGESREYFFMGCLPTPSECRYSCPTRGFWTYEDINGEIACNRYEYVDRYVCCCRANENS